MRLRSSVLLRTVVTSVVVTALAVAAVSCGLRGEDKATEIPRGSLPDILFQENPSNGDSTPNGHTERIFLVTTQGRGYRLDPVDVAIDGNGETVKAALDKLLAYAPPSNAGANGPANLIPHGSVVKSVERDGDNLLLDLGNFSLEGPVQWQAFAQIVFTATALPGIASVQFSIDGKAITVPLGEGSARAGERISRSRFPLLEATPATTTTRAPGTTARPSTTGADRATTSSSASTTSR